MRVDWYIYPLSMAAWPSDSRLIYELRPIGRTPATFAAFNSGGGRQPPLPKTPDLQAIIAADKVVSHGEVVHVIDLVKRAGVRRFAINVDPAAAGAGVGAGNGPGK